MPGVIDLRRTDIEQADRDQQVRRVLLIEGAANLTVLVIKFAVGVSAGSLAILADAIHSLMDVANNAIAWFVTRASAQPADSKHPYGHRKFETLAVFFVATLLTVLGIELALHAVRRGAPTVDAMPLGLGFMFGVLLINILLATWQRRWARRLDSAILHADASHTLADVLTTVAVIIGWQLSARGWPWLDSIGAIVVAAIVLYLAFKLFQRVVPVLVDERSVDAHSLKQAVGSVAGVIEVRRVRSRWQGDHPSVDVVVSVDAVLATDEAHEIADAIEAVLEERFGVEDTSVHIEPDTGSH